ncbi:MAG: hypothetical protein HQM14_18335 [SAR324 cluster bacterium]|nr:hypothetical protein [SAR324 cluster bacterium]
MTIIEEFFKAHQLPSYTLSWQCETVTLPWEERCRSHGKRKTDQGLPFALSLPSGTVLSEGDCFVLSEEQRVVTVCESEEDVYVLQPSSSYEWAYWSYQIGNRHQALMIGKTEIICMQEPAVKQLLDQLDLYYLEDRRRFTPTVKVSGHTH